MALDNKFDINNQNKVQSTPINTGSTSSTTGTESTSKVISFENTTKQDPVVETIKTEEFQQLTPEQQLAELKKKFPDIDEKTLQETINTVKSTIDQKETSQQTTDTTSTNENVSEDEQLLNQYAKEINKNNIDEVIAHIKSKNPKELTQKEQKILQNYETQKNNTKLIIRTETLEKYINKYGDEIDNIIPKSELNSKEWKSKTPKEKLDARADAVISRLNPNYDKITDPNVREKVKAEFYDKIGEIINPDWDTFKPEDKSKRIQMLAVMMDALETSGKPISTILTTDEQTRKDIMKQYGGRLINVIIADKNIDVTDPEWAQKNEKEQINAFADSVLETINPDFKTFSEEKKQEYRANFINKVGQEYIPNWDKLSNDDKAKFEKIFARQISAIKYSAETDGKIKTLEDYKNCDPKMQIELLERYEKAQKLQISTKDKIIRETIKSNNTYKISKKEILKTIDNQLKNQNLSPEARAELEKFREETFLASKISDNPDEKNVATLISTESDIKQKFKGNEKAYLQDIAKTYNLENIEDIKNNKEAMEYIFANCNDDKTRRRLCRLLGVNPKDVPQSKAQATDAMAQNLISADIKGIQTSTDVLHKIGAKKIVNNALYEAPKYVKDHNGRLAIGEHAVNVDKDYSNAVAKSWNNLEYVTTEEAKALGRDFDTSENVSNAAKSLFTKTFVETAANDQIRIEYGQELSKIDNSSVTEGLAAASNSVGNEYRNQYNSYVETAAQNYPPEQQANIRSAMKTGEISQETLSQTTPPSNENYSNKTSEGNLGKDSTNTTTNKSATSEAANTQNSNEVIQNDTPQVSGRTSVSDTTSIYNTAAQTQNFTTQLKQQNATEPTYSTATSATENSTTSANNTSAKAQNSSIDDNFTTEALQNKKEAVANNIENYQTKVESTNEEQQAKELSTENLEFIDKLLQENTEPTDSEREKIRQIFKNAGTNINAIYSIIIDRYGSQAQDKFLEILASNGSSDSIRSFVNGMKNDSSIIKKLYTHCSNQKLKSELLNMLPINDIISMITAGQIKISDLGTTNYKRVIAELKQSDPEKLNELFGEFENNIRDKISSGYTLNNADRLALQNYLTNNIEGMSNTKFSRYLQYLPIDTREELVALKNNPKTKTEEAENSQPQESKDSVDQANNAAKTNDLQTAKSQDEENIEKENKTQSLAQEKENKIFKDFETQTVLNDGTKVKRKETFGGISDNTDMYDDYEEISQVNETPSMKDPVLTPGSYEWQVKYNKQMDYQPKTQPTNLPEEDDGILLGSNKVSQRLKIDKMKKKGPFYFNA